ncbi:GntR family transcriptional regulator [Virgibacillus sp. YIM 98842]|jgi:GntR family transcriptional regulator|uniref:GntR family transcriptional regulator n=1 Tax=Virgibacillus sp. YIM 98842 TaxID=2663533 RepID=UPI0013D9A086|nr:GntR family transcriptional regulator [Virgibacillus sp. YIM 98842]
MSIRPDSRHLYLQVIDQLKRDMKEGKYKEREKLPSEYELSRMLGVSRATLREALRVLEEENIVFRKHGVGTFVNPKPIFSSGIEQLNSVTAMIEDSGKKAGTQYITSEVTKLSAEDKEQFADDELQSVFKIERVRTADNKPVVFCIDKLPENLLPQNSIKREESLFKALEKYANIHVSYALTRIEPVSYQQRIFNILNCDPSQPLLLLKQLHYTEKDEPVLYSSNYFRSDFFRFEVVRKRM